MKFQTFSVVTGTLQCNAKCPFCVAKMTPNQNVSFKEPKINLVNFEKACKLAEKCGVTTALITGKGEPTLYHDQIKTFLTLLENRFPIIELQTNGTLLNEESERLGTTNVLSMKYKVKHLQEWKDLGLSTIAISIIHYKDEMNKKLCGYDINLKKTIKQLHDIGFSVRLSCLLIKEYIESLDNVLDLIKFCKTNEVEQFTIRTLEKPKNCNNKIAKWIDENRTSAKNLADIEMFFDNNAILLLELIHGATVYDYKGQNVCLTHALTHTPNPEEIRQLIFFPDGHLRYDWQYKGAILL